MGEKKRKHVTLYANGVCPRLSGPGGYGVVLRYGNQRKELSGGFRLTTSDRMELMGAIAALEALKTRCNVTLYTNSRLLAEGVPKEEIETLRKEVWKNINRKVPDVDLWWRLAELIEKHTIQVILMKIYLEDREYERAVGLAKQAVQHRCCNIDTVYENRRAQKELPTSVPGPEPKFVKKKRSIPGQKSNPKPATASKKEPPTRVPGQKPKFIRKKRSISAQNPDGKGRKSNPKPVTAPKMVRCQYCGKEVGLYLNKELGEWVTIAHFGQAPVRRFGFGANMQIHCQGSNRPAK